MLINPLIRCAYSTENSITLFSMRYIGYVARAKFTPKNIIKVSYLKESSFLQWLINKILTLLLPIATLLYVLLRSTDGNREKSVQPILSEGTKGCIVIVISVLLLIGYLIFNYKLLKTPKGQSLARFHSAEHMVINAINILRRVPDLTELKGFSYYCNYCGQQRKADFIWMLMLLGIQVMFFSKTTLEIILALTIGYSIIITLRKIGLLYFLQRLTLLPPTEVELNVALAAANEWARYEFN